MLLLGMVAVTWVLVLGSRPVSSDASPVRFTVPKGAPARQIAASLRENGLIRSPLVFALTCRVSGSSGKLKPGVYELSRVMSAPEIIKRMVGGATLESWVTVPEGFTARQIADLLGDKDLVDPETFVQLAILRGYEFSAFRFIYDQSLEGYLFPDTYLVAKGMDAEGVIRKMLETFEKKIVTPNKTRLESTIRKRFKLEEDSFSVGLHRIIVLASLVEREAKVAEDRPLVAAVLWNRLAKDMKLEVDATVSYRPGESRGNKSRVLYSDLRSDSAYNTYKHYGLPPGPICNPGVASVQAVLEPADADYLYYVARPDGSHVFSRTFEEHKKARNDIRNGKL